MINKKEDRFLSPGDRPLECGECKRPIAVRYTEIVGGTITHTIMCSECPELQRRLYGLSPMEQIVSQTGITALECGNCGTTLDEVKRGHKLGCMECYEVFGDLIIQELQGIDRLPSRVLTSSKKSSPLHIGRGPGESLAVNPSSKLLALNEALRETLNREDYEQAAWLRDQIKALTEAEKKANGGKADGSVK